MTFAAIAAAAAALMSGAGVASAAPDRVTLLPAGPSTVRFAVEVPPARLEPVGERAEWVSLDLPGYSHAAKPGEPEVPARVVMVAVPPAGEVRVSGFARGFQIHDHVDLAPTPALERGPGGERLEKRARPARSAAAPPPPVVEAVQVTWLRDQRVAVIAVRPARWDAARRRLEVASQVEVTVEVDGRAAAAAVTPREARDPFEKSYESVLINYEQGKRWRRPERGRAGAALGARDVNEVTGVTLSESCVLAGHEWVKLTIPATGFYRLKLGQFRSLAPFNGDSLFVTDSLRMFAWEGYPVYPESGSQDSCRYREVAMQFLINGDGRFDDNEDDEIYFFALGASDWADVFDPAQPESLFLNHPYETRNYYFLSLGTPAAPFAGPPARIGSLDGTVAVDGGEITPATVATRLHYEQDLVSIPNLSPKSGGTELLWEKFFWSSATQGRSFPPLTLTAPGIEPSIPADLRVLMWGNDADNGGCTTFYSSHMLDVTVNSTSFPRQQWFGFREPLRVDLRLPLQETNTVNLAVPATPACPFRFDGQALAWAQIRYERRLRPVGNAFAFETPRAGGNYIYRIGPFTQAAVPRVFDVTDPFAPAEVVGLQYTPDPGDTTWTLSFETVEAGRRRFRVFPDLAAIPRVGLTDVRPASDRSLTNLRAAANGADYVILYYDEFHEAAEMLRAWRETHLPLEGDPGPYECLALPVSAIYDQFSGGRMDPGALRSFLRHAFHNWSQRPPYVTLMGDGSYDFKNLLGRAGPGRPGALIPSFQEGYSIGAMFASDDWIMDVTDDGAFLLADFYAGRIPVTDVPQARSVVERKIIAYERAAPQGTFRNRVMLIADDETQAHRPDPLRWVHLDQTADVDFTRIPEPFDREYVYLHKYGYASATVFTKPDAKAAIRRGINEGVVLMNYFGHGSPFKIADEDVLLDTDAGTLDNADRLTMFLAASCDVGKFDDPRVPSLGERMVLSLNGGAVAVISATELAYSQQNAELAMAFYRALFERSASTGQYHQSVSQALLNAKLTSSVGLTQNSQKYGVMGDCATRLNLPRRSVEVGLFACDTCQTPLTTIARGSVVTFRGSVVEHPGGPPAAMDGVVDLLIEDSAPYEQAPPCRLPVDQPVCTPDTLQRPFYHYKAGAMYRGNVRVQNGVFSGQFLVPLEARDGPRAKTRAYVIGRAPQDAAERDGAGSVMNTLVAGAPAPGDNAGPTINLSFGGGATSVRPDARLQIDLFDPSGILITGHNPQNGIIVTVDNNTTARADVTTSFRYAPGSYQSGTATFQLPNLPSGPHTIRVSAADNLAAGLGAGAHRSEATIAFEVSDVPPLSIGHAYLFPNPTRSGGPGSGGQFVVEARGDTLNALLRIYTISGRLVRTLKASGGIGQTQIGWDGLDDEGRALANGTYFFRVQVNARDEQGRSSARQRAVAEGRFVVLN